MRRQIRSHDLVDIDEPGRVKGSAGPAGPVAELRQLLRRVGNRGLTEAMATSRRPPTRTSGRRAPPPVEPDALLDQMGPDRPLDAVVARRMSTAHGRDLSSVRVHTDREGERLAEEMNAEAFTIGEHVAFAPGRYRPGTLIGDALIAHETAHVIQQRGGGTASTDYAGLEQDADRSAAHALMTLYAPETAAPVQAPTRKSGRRVSMGSCVEAEQAPRSLGCEGTPTCTITSAVRPVPPRGDWRNLTVEGETCLAAGVAELYRYEGDPENCSMAGTGGMAPISTAPVVNGEFTVRSLVYASMTPGWGQHVLVRVYDPSDPANSNPRNPGNAGVCCAEVTRK